MFCNVKIARCSRKPLTWIVILFSLCLVVHNWLLEYIGSLFTDVRNILPQNYTDLMQNSKLNTFYYGKKITSYLKKKQILLSKNVL